MNKFKLINLKLHLLPNLEFSLGMSNKEDNHQINLSLILKKKKLLSNMNDNYKNK
jgi:hypothetical protein